MLRTILSRTARRRLFAGAVMVAASFAGAVAVQAMQRDPAYAAARADGQIGEKPDGYLGFIGTPGATLRAMVDDLNIKRKAVYAAKAQAANATVEEYALTAGCLAISRTAAGEKYLGTDGVWRTRTAEPPMRDSRCPQI
jgi:uncharacterized protein